jgi:hypothetical protein
MSRQRLVRTIQLAALTFMLSACATAAKHDVAWGPVDGPMCEVRVESDFTIPVEAEARAGGLEIDLGVVEPGTAHEFGVPCTHRAVTVYRVLRIGRGAESQLDARAQALDADEVTIVRLRPPPSASRTGGRFDG